MPELLLLLLTAGAILLLLLAASVVRDARRPRRRTMAYALARGWPTEPAERGWPCETWTLERPGATLAVWEIEGVHAHDPEAPVIIMLHGWGESKIDLLARAEPWRAEAARLVLYDLRGHGESTGASRLGDGEEEDLLELIDRLDAKRVRLVAHSMGATIALFAAARHETDERARRIERITATGIYRDVHTPIRGRLRIMRMPGRPITDLALLLLRVFFKIRRRDVATLAAPTVRVPVQLIHGEADAIVPIADAQAIFASLGSRAASELHTIPNAGHQDVFRNSAKG